MFAQDLPVRAISLSPEAARKLARDNRLFAVLDACDAPIVFRKILSMGDEASCLFRGPLELSTLAEAPYLVRVSHEVLEWLEEVVWQDPWGIFVVADLSVSEVLKNLRRCLMVEGPEGNLLFFRFFDPRVLRTFFVSCAEDEAKHFFGPLQAFGAIGEEGRNIEIFALCT
jgi:hypothetical protein